MIPKKPRVQTGEAMFKKNATGNEAGKAARYASLTHPADSAGSRRTRPALSRCSHFASMLAASGAGMPNR
jgi:hypothetical protein